MFSREISDDLRSRKKKNVFGLVVTGLDYESRSPVVYYGIC